MILPLFCIVDLVTSNGFMPDVGELMMLNRLLIEHGVEHAMRNILANLCLLLLRHGGSMVGAAMESHNERTRNTQPLEC